jgi:hypothetical protein
MEKKPWAENRKKTAGLDAPDFRVEHHVSLSASCVRTCDDQHGQTQFIFTVYTT